MENIEIKGIEQKELETYKNLLSLKRGTVLQLAKMTAEKRTNLYRNIENLMEKGLVSEIYEGKKRFFIAESPKRLVDFANDERDKIKSLLPELESLEQKALSRPKIKFYEGKAALKNLYDEIYAEREEVLAIGNPESITKDISFHNDQIARRVRLRIPARAILTDSKFNRRRSKENWYRQVRISKNLRPSDAVFMIAGDKVMAFSHKNWITGVLIENKEIAQGLRAFFDALWAELK